MAAPLADVLGPDGPLAAALPGYVTRPQQVAMAEHVAAALETRTQLIVEAGTGTGKTFAYLVPALLSGRRVIVSTGTRTLQDQLYHRDLPTIGRALGRPVRVALLKGRANYLCRHRLELAEQQAYARGLRREVATALPKVRNWSYTTRRGDVAELPGLGEQDPVLPWVTSTRENCLGAECPRFDECFVLAARREAQAADIVVVNHYLLLADLVLKEEGFGDLLPGADAIVIDEAHQLPDVAAQFLGYSVSTRQLTNLSKDVAGELLLAQQMAGSVDAALSGLDAQVAAVLAVTAGQEARLEHAQWPERLLEALNGLGARAADLAAAIAPLGGPDGQAAFTRLQERLEESAQRLHELTAAEAPGGVRWAESTARSVSAHYAPVDVAQQLSALMEAQGCAWVLTSATLAVGEDFSHFKRRSGLARANTVRFESPFDFPNQALMYLPKGLADPGAPGHSRAVIEAALPVIAASGGRAFILFTSHRALREGAEELYRHWGERPPFPVLVQGGGARDQLLRAFREAGNAVLLGTGSFWEGIDVKGEALSVVVIDKLPFAVPDEPLLKARLAAIREQGGNPFFDEQVPQAVIALKQGVGRLIRDETDFGVVMLCDTRLVTKGYGRSFITSLPPMKRTRSLEEVQAFLHARLGTTPAEAVNP
ncbi:MAG TPA: ATP-dependent DNA helicase [Steroidobacteraceae bacterium]|nr:ATP-dependent DNA helicase [Steroidobacteraceae bacterium]